MVFSFGIFLRNLAHMTETDPKDFAANLARMALPNNNQGTECQDDCSNGDVLARLISHMTGDNYARLPDDTNRKSTTSSSPAKPITAAPRASTNAVSPMHKASTKQRKPFWPLFVPSKPKTSKSKVDTAITKPKEMEVDLDDDASFVSCRSEPQAGLHNSHGLR